MNKKERRLALLSALSLRYQEKALIAVDSLNLESNKTKDFAKSLESIKAGKTNKVPNNSKTNVTKISLRINGITLGMEVPPVA